MPLPTGARRWVWARPNWRACARARRAGSSGLDGDVAVLDVNRKGLGDVRTLGQRFAVLDYDRVGPDLDALRVEPGLPGAHVEFPAVPGAAQQLADPGALVDAGLRRGQPRHARRLVERRAFVRTAVEQREELAVDMEHDDVAAIHANHLVAAGRDFIGAGDDVTGHRIKACRARGRCR